MKTINMLIGLPGIGKSTFIRQQFNNQPITVLSTDAIRKELTGDEANTSKDKKMWATLYDRFESSLQSTRKNDANIVLDATFLNRKRRVSFFEIIRNWINNQGGDCILNVFTFPVDPKLAIERQKGRDRKVPEKAIFSMAKFFQPFTAEEAKGINHNNIKLDQDNKPINKKAS